MNSGSTNPYLSAPVPVDMFGWRSDTFTLQQNGWKFAVEYDQRDMTYRLLLKHRSNHMMGLTAYARVADYHRMSMSSRSMPPISMSVMGDRLYVPDHYRGRRFHHVDMTPTIRDGYYKTVPVEPQGRWFDAEYLCVWKPMGDEHITQHTPKLQEFTIGDLMGQLKDKYKESDAEFYKNKIDVDTNIISDPAEVKQHLRLIL